MAPASSRAGAPRITCHVSLAKQLRKSSHLNVRQDFRRGQIVGTAEDWDSLWPHSSEKRPRGCGTAKDHVRDKGMATRVRVF